MSKITDIVSSLAKPIVEEQGCTLWDIDFVKEAGSRFLRVYIDNTDGVTIENCESVSRALSDLLDEVDPIAEAYTFEVSSAGADRVLKTPEHFSSFLNEMVEVRLYKAQNGSKILIGSLSSYDDGNIAIVIEDETFQLSKQDVAQVRLHVSF